MGSSISRGRKFSPKKNESDSHPSALLEHAKFSYADPPQERDFVEDIVCDEKDLEENEIHVFNLKSQEFKVLVIKQKGKIYATGTKCPHYGAPLAKGHLGNGRIRCQWHGACFNLSSGDIEDFPGLDSLPCYEVKLINGNVIVRAEKNLLRTNKRVRPFLKTVIPSKGTFIVVGGGPAGTSCVENLRVQGFEGRIVFVVGEKHLPYDRVKLSKSMDAEVGQLTLRTMEFFNERNIEVMLERKLSRIHPSRKEAVLDNGETLRYDKIFLATGSTPRHLEVSGSNLQNIFVLRTMDDASKIKDSLTPNSEVVIIGPSFIGMESAAYCFGKVKSVTVVGREIPFKSVFGTEIGKAILKLYQDKGVKFYLKVNVTEFAGENGKLKAVQLSDGTILPADICLLGIGATCATSYLKSSGIKMAAEGEVDVNEYLQTNIPEVFAGGDIALAPVLGQKANIGHWGLASYHGYIAAFNMLGRKKPLRTVPFFWTMLFGKGIRYAGYAKTFDDVVIDGNLSGLEFAAFLCLDNQVVAITTCNRDPMAARFAEMLHDGIRLKKDDIPGWIKKGKTEKEDFSRTQSSA